MSFAPNVESLLRSFVTEAIDAIAGSGKPTSAFRGTVNYDQDKDTFFEGMTHFVPARDGLSELPSVRAAGLSGDARRLTLQILYETLRRIDSAEGWSSAFDEVLAGLERELEEPTWTYRTVANLYSFEVPAFVPSSGFGPIEMGDGVTIAPRDLAALRGLGFEESVLHALVHDWESVHFGRSSFVILVEETIPKSGDNLLARGRPQAMTRIARCIGSMRLAAPGDVGIGSMLGCRVSHFNVGTGGLAMQLPGSRSGHPGGRPYLWDAALLTKVQSLYANLKHLEEHGYARRAPGNLDLALRSFMGTYDRWPPGPDSQLLDSITALEAVLGGRGSVAFRLAFRVSGLVASDTAGQREEIFRKMKGFYATRSDLVHGNDIASTNHASRLMDVDTLRAWARSILAAFVAFGASEGATPYSRRFFDEELDGTLLNEPARRALQAALGLGALILSA